MFTFKRGAIVTGFILMVAFVILGFAANWIYEVKRGPIEGVLAANQVTDDVDSYEIMRMVSSNIVPKIICWSVVGAILTTWVLIGIVLYDPDSCGESHEVDNGM